MGVRINARYEGELRCAAQHGPSGASFATDAPVDNHGRGAAFSPTDLVAAAHLTCAMTVMGIVARRDGIPLDGMTGEVVKDMVQDPLRRVAAVPLVIRIPGRLTAEQKQKLEHAARTCPVGQSLRPDIARSIEFVYDA